MIWCLNYKVCASWDGSFRLISFCRWPFASCQNQKMRENAGDWPHALVVKAFYRSQFSSSASHAKTHPLVVIFGPASCNLQPSHPAEKTSAVITSHRKLPDQVSRLPDLHGVKRFALHACRPVVCVMAELASRERQLPARRLCKRYSSAFFGTTTKHQNLLKKNQKVG